MFRLAVTSSACDRYKDASVHVSVLVFLCLQPCQSCSSVFVRGPQRGQPRLHWLGTGMCEQCVSGIPLPGGFCLSEWTHIFIYRTLPPSLFLPLPAASICNRKRKAEKQMQDKRDDCYPFLACFCLSHSWDVCLLHTWIAPQVCMKRSPKSPLLSATLSINPHCSSQRPAAHCCTPFIYSLGQPHRSGSALFCSRFSPLILSFGIPSPT